MKICLVVNDSSYRDIIKGTLPPEWDIKVISHGDPVMGHRFDLVLLTSFINRENDTMKQKAVSDWLYYLPTRLSPTGRILSI